MPSFKGGKNRRGTVWGRGEGSQMVGGMAAAIFPLSVPSPEGKAVP